MDIIFSKIEDIIRDKCASYSYLFKDKSRIYSDNTSRSDLMHITLRVNETTLGLLKIIETQLVKSGLSCIICSNFDNPEADNLDNITIFFSYENITSLYKNIYGIRSASFWYTSYTHAKTLEYAKSCRVHHGIYFYNTGLYSPFPI